MSKKRRSRFEREAKGAVDFNPERDPDVLKALFDCQLLTTSQIGNLLFPSKQAAVKRLRKLFDGSFVERIHRPAVVGSKEVLYTLGNEGIRYLVGVEGLNEKAVRKSRIKARKHKDTAYPHIIGVNQIRVAFDSASNSRDDYNMLFWKYDTELRDEKNRSFKVKSPDDPKATLSVTPDAFFGIETPKGKSYLFVEYQIGKVNPSRFREKMLGYAAFWRDRKNGFRAYFPYQGFRVLVVTEEKVDGFIRATSKVDDLLQIYYFIEEGFIASDVLFDVPDAILGPVWRTVNRDSSQHLFQ